MLEVCRIIWHFNGFCCTSTCWRSVALSDTLMVLLRKHMLEVCRIIWCHVKLLPSLRTFCVHHTTMRQFTVAFLSIRQKGRLYKCIGRCWKSVALSDTLCCAAQAHAGGLSHYLTLWLNCRRTSRCRRSDTLCSESNERGTCINTCMSSVALTKRGICISTCLRSMALFDTLYFGYRKSFASRSIRLKIVAPSGIVLYGPIEINVSTGQVRAWGLAHALCDTWCSGLNERRQHNRTLEVLRIIWHFVSWI